MAPLSKSVTKKEFESGRISIPASVRDHVLPHLLENTQTALTMIDEKGDSYDVVIKLRDNRTKPEIMSRGGRIFARKRLSVFDVLVFSRGDSPHTFKVKVHKWLRLTPSGPNPQGPPTIPCFGIFPVQAAKLPSLPTGIDLSTMLGPPPETQAFNSACGSVVI